MAAVGALMLMPRVALAGPTGGTVVQGSAGIQQSGNTTNINQSSNNAIINWQSFSIGSGQTVNFNQPSAASATLNRVIGNETSVINGALNANGQVFIVNSAGVLFGKGAQVNVGGLVASTLDISNENFMAGKYSFSGASTASVINRGTIHASPGGYVSLLGKTVANDGVIVANLGTVALASGSQITLNFGGNSLVDVTIDKGVLNALVSNKRAIIANGGQVIMTAKAADEVLSAQVNNSGIIQARTMAALKGGSGTQVAKKGSIKLLADGGTVNVTGKLDASAPKGGDGGFIETSGNKVKIASNAIVTTKSAKGSNGTWLIDPDGFTIAATGGDITGAQLSSELATNDIVIASTSGSGSDGNVNVNDNVTWSTGNTLTLNATNAININAVISGVNGGLALNAGTDINVNAPSSVQVATLNATALGNVNLNAPQTWTNNGAWTFSGTNINVNDAVNWSAGTLTMNAGANVFVNAVMAASGSANFTANYGTGTNADGTPNSLYMAVNAPGGVPDGTFAGRLDFNSTGALTLGGAVYTVVHSLADLVTFTTADFNANGGTIVGHYALGSDLDATGTGYAASGSHSNQTSTNLDTLGYAVIGNLSGAIDGLGHSVKNLGIYDTDGAVANGHANADALIGGAGSGSVIRNLGVANVDIVSTGPFQSGANAAAIVGTNFGTIHNVVVTGTIAGDSDIGGITPVNIGLIANAYTNLAITGTQSDIGGLVGLNGSIILDSITNGSVTVDALVVGSNVTASNQIGGLVGFNVGTIQGSQSNVAVTTTNSANAVGGLVGSNSGTISNSSATGNVTLTVTNTGQGFTGVGGLVGDNSSGAISFSSASGNVVASTVGANQGANTNLGTAISGVGGLVGTNESPFGGALGTIDHSVATGSVTGLGAATSVVGGLVGNNAGGSITNSSAFGKVTNGSLFVGGLVGADSLGNGIFSGNTFNPGTTGQTNAFGTSPGNPPGTSPTGATGPAAGQGPTAPPPSPLQSAATARSQAQVLTQQATAQQTAVAQAAAAQAAATQAATAQAAAARAAIQQATSTANVIGTTDTQMSAATPPTPALSTAGTKAVDAVAPPTVEDNLKTIENNIKVEEQRRRRRLATTTGSRQGTGHRGGNLGATIRSIDVDGQRFNLQNGAPKSDAPAQPPH